MSNNARLQNWTIEADKVKLTYKDGESLYVTKKDFDRAFGCIVALTRAEAQRDFAIAT